MSLKKIIPCLDCKDGRVVKGVSFVDLRDAGDPVEIAAAYCAEGADELVLLDITATTDYRATKLDLVRKVAEVVTVPFAVGGGIHSVDEFREVINAGADKAAVNSAAISYPELIRELADEFGSEKVVSAIDAVRRKDGTGWNVVRNSGTDDTGIDVIEWAKKVEELGAGEILLTSMDEDGQKNGYDIELTKTVADAVTLPATASGGAGSKEDILAAFTEAGAAAALAASLFHFREVGIKELKEYLKENGIEVSL